MKNEVNRALVAKKKLFLSFALLTLSVGLWAIDNVKYLDANGQEQTANGVIEVTSSTTAVTWGEEDETTWYVVTGTDVQLSKGAVCHGDVHLILADGAKLTATGAYGQAGIRVSDEDKEDEKDGPSLTIYGQANQSGQLIANGGEMAAGIGGRPGDSGSNITINGGVITANGGEDAAGIGGGNVQDGSNITINGGTVTANGVGGGAGIGGGYEGSGFNITINGGTVTANGGEVAAGIGGGYEGSGSNIKVKTEGVVKAGNNENPTGVITNTGGDLAGSLAGKRYVTVVFTSTPVVDPTSKSNSYIDENGQEQTADGVTEITNASTTLNEGWYVVLGNNVTTGSLICNGAVHLILADGAKLTAQELAFAGIQVSGGASLTIYGQTAQSGQLIAISGGYGCAGIGGTAGSGSNITINGGIVTATGGYEGSAGIGGGVGSSGSNITINGGAVTATGGPRSAGIGGGSCGAGSHITINGGTVTATGGIEAAGIGGGVGSSGSDITINGGAVTATGGSSQNGCGSSIGSGYDSPTAASNIKVASYIIVKAGDNENPTGVITNTGGDLANDLAGKRYATTEQPANPLSSAQTEAIAEIDAAIEGITDTDILAVANQAKTDINAATTIVAVISIKEKTLATISLATAKSSAVAEIQAAGQGILNENLNNWINAAIDDIQKGGPDATPGINEIKDQILAIIKFFKDGKAEGFEEGHDIGFGEGEASGYLDALNELPTDPEGTAGHTVTITKGDKTLILVNPDKVTYGKQE